VPIIQGKKKKIFLKSEIVETTHGSEVSIVQPVELFKLVKHSKSEEAFTILQGC